MATAPERARADAVVRAIQAEGDAITGATDPQSRALQQQLLRDMRAAEAALDARLRRTVVFHPTERFSTAQATAFREQLRVATAHMEARLQTRVDARITRAATAAARNASAVLTSMERAYSSVATPIPMRAAAALGGPLRSRLAQSQSSVARYGQHMIGVAERELRLGLLQGLTQHEMVQHLTGLRTPGGGLFVQNSGWAWRIVRTEGAFAYNAAHQEALIQQQREMPDLQKKILAMFDQRTAFDSVAVHGQIRDLNDDFVDGAGRVYPFPPARPNDREVIIPWRPHWEETTTTAPLPPEQVQRAREAARPGTAVRRGAPPIQLHQPTPEQVMAKVLRAARVQTPTQRGAQAPQQAPQPVPTTPAWRTYTAQHEALVGPALDNQACRAPIAAAIKAGDLPQLRQRIRQRLRADDIVSRDVLVRPRGAESARYMPQRGAVLGWDGQHSWGGEVRLASDQRRTLREAAHALTRQVRGERRAGDSWDVAYGLRVAVHEELHGCSPAVGSAYHGCGRVLEEVCTELQARRIVGEISGEGVSSLSTGSYQDYITQVNRALPQSYVDRHSLLSERARVMRVEAAGRSAWHATERIDTPETYARVVANHLPDSTPEEREHFHRGLLALRPHP